MRRAWARNEGALETASAFNQRRGGEHITAPYIADDAYLAGLVGK